MKTQVLLVEDEVRMAKLLELDLNDAGYQVTVAYDGETGWQLALAEPPGVIILDWQLPTLTGLEVCQRLRTSGQATPIIFATALDDRDRCQAALQAGANEYVTKPFKIEQLIDMIEQYQPLSEV